MLNTRKHLCSLHYRESGLHIKREFNTGIFFQYSYKLFDFNFISGIIVGSSEKLIT